MKNPFAIMAALLMGGLQAVRPTKTKYSPTKQAASAAIQHAIQIKAEEKRQRKQSLRRQMLDRQTGRKGTMQ